MLNFSICDYQIWDLGTSTNPRIRCIARLACSADVINLYFSHKQLFPRVHLLITFKSLILLIKNYNEDIDNFRISVSSSDLDIYPVSIKDFLFQNCIDKETMSFYFYEPIL